MSNPRTHLVIGTPCYGGQVASLYTTSLLRLQHACTKRGDLDFSFLLLGGDALITRARQDLVTLFLENKTATHLLFVDGDIAFEPDQVFRLLDLGAEMAAGVYPVKRIDWDKVRALVQSGRVPQEAESLSYVLEFDDPQRIATKNGFAKARYAGSGFLMIHRSALLKMIEKYPDLRYAREHKSGDNLTESPYRYALFNCFIDKESGTYLSEDFSFCRRWTDMGGEIWVDLNSRLTHLGPMAFNGNVATQFVEPRENP
jgi:hypothetical protein